MEFVKSPKKRKLTDSEWNELMEKNALHRAHLQIEACNPEKIALALSDMPVLKVLEFLFHLAEKHRKDRKFLKTKVLLEAAALIDRKKNTELDIELKIDARDGEEKTTLQVKRHTPAEIFEMKIPRKQPVRKAIKTKRPKAPSKSQAAPRH